MKKDSLLDDAAPFLSGIGAICGYALTLMTITNESTFWPICFTLLLVPALTYIFCTCTQRKHFFYSKAALVSAMGSILALVIGENIGVIFAVIGPEFIIAFNIFLLFVIPSSICRYVCRNERKKVDG